MMLGFRPSTFCIQNRHSNHYTNCSQIVHQLFILYVTALVNVSNVTCGMFLFGEVFIFA